MVGNVELLSYPDPIGEFNSGLQCQPQSCNFNLVFGLPSYLGQGGENGNNIDGGSHPRSGEYDSRFIEPPGTQRGLPGKKIDNMASSCENLLPSKHRSLHKEKQHTFENFLHLEKCKGKGKRKRKSFEKRTSQVKPTRQRIPNKLVEHGSNHPSSDNSDNEKLKNV
jgi:hypothetical protein